MTEQHEKTREGAPWRSRLTSRYALAALPLATGIAAAQLALFNGLRPQHLALALATGFAALSGIGKRAAP